MAADFLFALLLANIAAGAAILLVLAMREPVRRVAGARLAYWLWLAPIVAGFAGLLPTPPAQVIRIVPPAATAPLEAVGAATVEPAAAAAAPAMPAIDPIAALVILWAVGAAGCLALVLARQARTMRSFSTHGMSGPAVVGVMRPRVIEPADFEQRFSARERELILAHERAHIGAGDTRINTVLALLTCFNWFNPLVHLAVRLARTDQELACDAAVVERFPGERRTYAEALLKTQLSPASLPLGCTWPTRSSSLLKERVMMLARKSPGSAGRAAGVLLVALLAGGAGLAAWAAQPNPPVYVFDQAPQQASVSSELPKDALTLFKIMPRLMMAYRDRVIPLDQIIEASVTAELRNGEVLGPYRMYSSLPNNIRSSEFANGDKGFKADGDDRFVGGVLGSVDADGGLTLDFGLVVDGDPIEVERLKARSGASVTVERNGVKLTIQPVLRPMTAAELKRRIASRKGPVKAKLQQDKAPATPPKPDAGSPALDGGKKKVDDFQLQFGPWKPLKRGDTFELIEPNGKKQQMKIDDLQLDFGHAKGVKPGDPGYKELVEGLLKRRTDEAPVDRLANAVITCNAWAGRHSNDPKVDWDDVKDNAPVVLTFKDRRGLVALPNAAFPAGAYPASVADAEKGLSLRTGDRFVYQSISPSVIDTITFDGLETGDLRAVWQRFRIDTDKPRAIALQGRCVRS